MIDQDFAALVALLQLFLWPLLRIGAFLLAAPLYSVEAFSVRLRIATALVLTVFFIDRVPVPEFDPLTAAGLGAIAGEILTGVLLGFCLQTVNAAMAIAGAIVSNAMGLSFANIVDPALGNIPVLSQFFVILAALLFMSIDGHLQLINLLGESFLLIPIGQLPEFGRWYEVLVQWLPEMFGFALTLALPITASLLLINLGLGLVTRSAPAMNIFSIGFPALLLCGLIFLLLSLPGFATAVGFIWRQALDTALLLLGG